MDKKALNDNELKNVSGGQAVLPLLSNEAEGPNDGVLCGAEQNEFHVGMNKYELVDDPSYNH